MKTSFENLGESYRTLGLPLTNSATEADVKAAYKFMQAAFHPDKHGSSESHRDLATKKSQEINAAREEILEAIKAGVWPGAQSSAQAEDFKREERSAPEPESDKEAQEKKYEKKMQEEKDKKERVRIKQAVALIDVIKEENFPYLAGVKVTEWLNMEITKGVELKELQGIVGQLGFSIKDSIKEVPISVRLLRRIFVKAPHYRFFAQYTNSSSYKDTVNWIKRKAWENEQQF